MKLLALLLISFVLTFSSQVNAQNKWQKADEATRRLQPYEFRRLPKNIVLFLETRGCTVPQTYDNAKPHNVIRGQFAKSGQFDWAVLCSRSRVSSILVFWNGSTNSVAELAASDDNAFLQTIDGDGTIGFSRYIDVVGKKAILEKYREYGGSKPPPIKYQGINDAFTEKASTVHYFYRKQWMELQGAD